MMSQKVVVELNPIVFEAASQLELGNKLQLKDGEKYVDLERGKSYFRLEFDVEGADPIENPLICYPFAKIHSQPVYESQCVTSRPTNSCEAKNSETASTEDCETQSLDDYGDDTLCSSTEQEGNPLKKFRVGRSTRNKLNVTERSHMSRTKSKGNTDNNMGSTKTYTVARATSENSITRQRYAHQVDIDVEQIRFGKRAKVQLQRLSSEICEKYNCELPSEMEHIIIVSTEVKDERVESSMTSHEQALKDLEKEFELKIVDVSGGDNSSRLNLTRKYLVSCVICGLMIKLCDIPKHLRNTHKQRDGENFMLRTYNKLKDRLGSVYVIPCRSCKRNISIQSIEQHEKECGAGKNNESVSTSTESHRRKVQPLKLFNRKPRTKRKHKCSANSYDRHDTDSEKAILQSIMRDYDVKIEYLQIEIPTGLTVGTSEVSDENQPRRFSISCVACGDQIPQNSIAMHFKENHSERTDVTRVLLAYGTIKRRLRELRYDTCRYCHKSMRRVNLRRHLESCKNKPVQARLLNADRNSGENKTLKTTGKMITKATDPIGMFISEINQDLGIKVVRIETLHESNVENKDNSNVGNDIGDNVLTLSASKEKKQLRAGTVASGEESLKYSLRHRSLSQPSCSTAVEHEISERENRTDLQRKAGTPSQINLEEYYSVSCKLCDMNFPLSSVIQHLNDKHKNHKEFDSVIDMYSNVIKRMKDLMDSKSRPKGFIRENRDSTVDEGCQIIGIENELPKSFKENIADIEKQFKVNVKLLPSVTSDNICEILQSDKLPYFTISCQLCNEDIQYSSINNHLKIRHDLLPTSAPYVTYTKIKRRLRELRQVTCRWCGQSYRSVNIAAHSSGCSMNPGVSIENMQDVVAEQQEIDAILERINSSFKIRVVRANMSASQLVRGGPEVLNESFIVTCCLCQAQFEHFDIQEHLNASHSDDLSLAAIRERYYQALVMLVGDDEAECLFCNQKQPISELAAHMKLCRVQMSRSSGVDQSLASATALDLLVQSLSRRFRVEISRCPMYNSDSDVEENDTAPPKSGTGVNSKTTNPDYSDDSETPLFMVTCELCREGVLHLTMRTHLRKFHAQECTQDTVEKYTKIVRRLQDLRKQKCPHCQHFFRIVSLRVHMQRCKKEHTDTAGEVLVENSASLNCNAQKTSENQSEANPRSSLEAVTDRAHSATSAGKVVPAKSSAKRTTRRRSSQMREKQAMVDQNESNSECQALCEAVLNKHGVTIVHSATENVLEIECEFCGDKFKLELIRMHVELMHADVKNIEIYVDKYKTVVRQIRETQKRQKTRTVACKFCGRRIYQQRLNSYKIHLRKCPMNPDRKRIDPNDPLEDVGDQANTVTSQNKTSHINNDVTKGNPNDLTKVNTLKCTTNTGNTENIQSKRNWVNVGNANTSEQMQCWGIYGNTNSVSSPVPQTTSDLQDNGSNLSHVKICAICSGQLDTATQLIHHLTREHRKHPNYRTIWMDANRVREQSLQTLPKKERQLSQRVQRCKGCGFATHSEPEMTKHKKSCAKWKQTNVQQCDICGLVFKNISSRWYHMKNRHGVGLNKRKAKFFPCPVCGKEWDVPSRLEKHMLTHTDQRNYICDVCAMPFRTNFGLNRHVERIHKNIYPFYCQKCGHGLKNKFWLKRHRCDRRRKVRVSRHVRKFQTTPAETNDNNSNDTLAPNGEDVNSAENDGDANLSGNGQGQGPNDDTRRQTRSRTARAKKFKMADKDRKPATPRVCLQRVSLPQIAKNKPEVAIVIQPWDSPVSSGNNEANLEQDNNTEQHHQEEIDENEAAVQEIINSTVEYMTDEETMETIIYENAMDLEREEVVIENEGNVEVQYILSSEYEEGQLVYDEHNPVLITLDGDESEFNEQPDSGLDGQCCEAEYVVSEEDIVTSVETLVNDSEGLSTEAVSQADVEYFLVHTSQAVSQLGCSTDFNQSNTCVVIKEGQNQSEFAIQIGPNNENQSDYAIQTGANTMNQLDYSIQTGANTENQSDLNVSFITSSANQSDSSFNFIPVAENTSDFSLENIANDIVPMTDEPSVTSENRTDMSEEIPVMSTEIILQETPLGASASTELGKS